MIIKVLVRTMVKILVYISNFREVADYLKIRHINDVCVLGRKNIYALFLTLYFKIRGFKVIRIKDARKLYDLNKKSNCVLEKFFLILDSEYRRWLGIIKKNKNESNYFVFYV